MLSFTFQTTPSILIEAGAASRIGNLLVERGARSVFVVTDRGIVSAGLHEAALANMREAGLSVATFEDVVADPPEAVVEAAAAAAREAGADTVVGIGGGSSLDVAKLVALLAASEVRLDDVYGVGLAKGPRLPLVLVPTTAGTGSEVTPISIVTTRSGEKKGVVSPPLLPDVAILDADLTLGLPAHVSAATGIDAMVHAIEAITSKRLRNPMSDALAREALRLLSSNIRLACLEPTREARERMLLGSCLAGMAFANAPVAAVHALAYPIGARFHVPHGLSNAMVLPCVIAFNAPECDEAYRDIADIVFPGNEDAPAGQRLADGFRNLATELGLDIRLSSAGIGRDDLPRLAEDAMKQTRLLVNNPRDMTYDDALAIYETSL